MVPVEYLVTITASVFAVLCLPLLWGAYRRTGELLSPWTMFLGMALVDFYLPAALFFPVGLDLPPWLSLLARDVVMPAVLVFTVAAVFFGWGYTAAIRRPVPGSDNRFGVYQPSKWRTLVVVALVLAMYYATILADVSTAGGLSEYWAGRLSNRLAAPTEQSAWISLFGSLKGMLLPVLFIMAGVCFSKRHSWRVLAFVVPLLAALTAASTLLRGSILTLLIGLAIIERARLHDLEAAGRAGARVTAAVTNRWIVGACFAGGLLFVSYGTARNYFTEQADLGHGDLAHAAATEVSRFVRGEGFIGLVAVMDAYPRDVPFMRGRTILDMLLLPVPRALWPSKPAWYGIDDITRAMGWPVSSQSAVTMPGELYANFAGWGLPLMWVYGWIFGILRGHRFGPLFRFVYAFVIVPMMLPTFWMAFTGFVNQLAPIPFIMLSLWFVFPRSHTVRRRAPVAALA
jgi:hypothetical protein